MADRESTSRSSIGCELRAKSFRSLEMSEMLCQGFCEVKDPIDFKMNGSSSVQNGFVYQALNGLR
jgi:hypothetical protein